MDSERCAAAVRGLRTIGATDGRCRPSVVEDQYERCLCGHEGLAPVTDRLGLGCGGVGARSGAAGESIGAECHTGTPAANLWKSLAAPASPYLLR